MPSAQTHSPSRTAYRNCKYPFYMLIHWNFLCSEKKTQYSMLIYNLTVISTTSTVFNFLHCMHSVQCTHNVCVCTLCCTTCINANTLMPLIISFFTSFRLYWLWHVSSILIRIDFLFDRFLNNNQITKLDRRAFEPLVHLIELKANKNRIGQLPTGLFTKLKKLKKL